MLLGSFMAKTQTLGEECIELHANRLSRNEMWYAVDNSVTRYSDYVQKHF